MSPGEKKPLTPSEFVIRAIETLRNPPYKGIHTVYSGFNQAFREYFPGLDPVDVTRQMAEEGTIVIRIARGGVVIYKAEEAPASLNVKETLTKMGLNRALFGSSENDSKLTP